MCVSVQVWLLWQQQLSRWRTTGSPSTLAGSVEPAARLVMWHCIWAISTQEYGATATQTPAVNTTHNTYRQLHDCSRDDLRCAQLPLPEIQTDLVSLALQEQAVAGALRPCDSLAHFKRQVPLQSPELGFELLLQYGYVKHWRRMKCS